MESEAILYEGALTICLEGCGCSLSLLVGLDNYHDEKKLKQPNQADAYLKHLWFHTCNIGIILKNSL